MPQRRRLSGRTSDPPAVRLSKTLAYALRHGAVDLHLNMRPSGFVPLAQLLALPLFASFTESQVEAVVRTNAKKRFTITTDASGDVKYIRANQGHSLALVQDTDLLTPIEDPTALGHCVHGTYRDKWDHIWQTGLSKMQRNHIHFTEKHVMDHVVGRAMRATCNVLVYIDVPTAVQDGIKFYRSSNDVLLSPGRDDTGCIDRHYFLLAITTEGSVLYKKQGTAGVLIYD